MQRNAAWKCLNLIEECRIEAKKWESEWLLKHCRFSLLLQYISHDCNDPTEDLHLCDILWVESCQPEAAINSHEELMADRTVCTFPCTHTHTHYRGTSNLENKNIKKTFYFISRDNNFLIFWASEEQIIYLLTVSNFLVFLLFILRRGWADCLAGCLALQDGTSSPM